ncbi:MAG: exodeoxyribonuclease VII small subunit [Chthoniobacterales bacterium]|jgi:exodeoxyribonuclease VII small subunit
MASPAKNAAEEMNFERAMERLETIVDEMESGKMMLEELIVRYEEGMKLVGICQERLATAEKRIEIITRNHAGKAVVKEFEPGATETSRAARSEDKENGTDVSLF